LADLVGSSYSSTVQHHSSGYRFGKLGGPWQAVHAEGKSIMGAWGGASSRVQGQSPWWGSKAR